MSSNEKATAARLAVVGDLEHLGYFDFVPRSEVQACKDRIVQTGDPFLDQTRRVAMVDIENLVELGLEEFNHEIRPLLQHRGIESPVFEEVQWTGGVLEFRGGEQVYRPWTVEDLRAKRYFYILKQALQLVEDWLGVAGSPEKVFARPEFNDSLVVLMTNEMFERIRNRSSGLRCPVMPLASLA